MKMNDDLISRTATLKDLQHKKEALKNYAATADFACGYLSAISDFSAQIEHAPAVDAEPVRHGWWNAEYEYEDFLYALCSVCNEESKYMHKYCPNCGAKMDASGGD